MAATLTKEQILDGIAELSVIELSELLEQFAQFDDRKLSDAVENLFLGQGCSHGHSFLFFVSVLR